MAYANYILNRDHLEVSTGRNVNLYIKKFSDMEDIVDIKQFRVIFKTICLVYLLLLYRVLSLNYFHCPTGTILIANDQTVGGASPTIPPKNRFPAKMTHEISLYSN